MVYPHKWSPISYRSSAGQGKHAGQRPMFYRWTTSQLRSVSSVCDEFVSEIRRYQSLSASCTALIQCSWRGSSGLTTGAPRQQADQPRTTCQVALLRPAAARQRPRLWLADDSAASNQADTRRNVAPLREETSLST